MNCTLSILLGLLTACSGPKEDLDDSATSSQDTEPQSQDSDPAPSGDSQEPSVQDSEKTSDSQPSEDSAEGSDSAPPDSDGVRVSVVVLDSEAFEGGVKSHPYHRRILWSIM